jgi:hypothetical protein
LEGLLRCLKGSAIPNGEGGVVTLPSVTGLSYATLAVAFAGVTLAVVFLLRHRRTTEGGALRETNDSPLAQRILTRPWKPWQSGVAIGLLALAAYASSAASGRNYPLGVTHGVLHVELLATDHPVRHVWEKKPEPSYAAGDPGTREGADKPRPEKKVVWWLVGLVSFVVVGSHVSARLRGNFHLLPKPPDETIVAFLGGLMVGSGAALATGCVVGNMMSGVALMSIGNMLFVLVVAVSNWAATYVYMVGQN